MNPEAGRIQDNALGSHIWHRWGPYVSERQWGTVREDYSQDGAAWSYFPHDHARSRAYRWGEDGIGGFSDRHGNLNLTFAFWNGVDPILKERLYGLTNDEGNHGEDVKECYWYLAGTPTHSYMQMMYRYPQRAFPYEELQRRNGPEKRHLSEVEIYDLDLFAENRFFDITIEYAKAGPDEIYVLVTAKNCGPEKAPLHILPQACFRNTWSWAPGSDRPSFAVGDAGVEVHHPRYGLSSLQFDGKPAMLFTENETNHFRIHGTPNESPYVKDAFHRAIVNGEAGVTNPFLTGTKVAAHYAFEVESGESVTVRFALRDLFTFPQDFDSIMDSRRAECEQFYEELSPGLPVEVARVQRQSFAGLLWSKQYYHFDVDRWIMGDPGQPKPKRDVLRNDTWTHVHTAEVISMPDKWEYPWFAAWDLAFHMIPFALIDSEFAKGQLLLILREWYMHPNGQLPAYEWNFSDVNPPVHAWATWRVYSMEKRATGKPDIKFLKRAFHKLLLNFTWWVNRKDEMGNNLFEGGFLGLDNVGVFDRNHPLPDGSFAEQSDGTAWMALFCLNMLEIALELARDDSAYEDVASKFFEHFMYISTAMNSQDSMAPNLWDDEDGFYYDVLHHASGHVERMKIRSIVGLIPLFAVTTLEPEDIARFPGFRRRMQWFLKNRPEMTANVASMQTMGMEERILISLVGPDRLRCLLARMLDPKEFLSPFGIRSVSKVYEKEPYVLNAGGMQYRLNYEPGESQTSAFGGNSNWRGPIWFPINFLIIESLQKFDHYFGDDFKVKTEAGDQRLSEVASDLERRLLDLFLPDGNGVTPAFGPPHEMPCDPQHLWFHEYFHAETGRGLGASHQTGWTAVIAKIIQQLYVTAPNRNR